MRFSIALAMPAIALTAACVAPALADTAHNPGPVVTLTLRQAIDLALANNLTYRVAQADVRAAAGRVMQAGAGRVPTVTAGYSHFHQQTPPTFAFGSTRFAFGSTDVNTVDATLNWALFNGGATQAAIGAAAAGYAGAQAQLAASRNTTVRDVTTAYFRLIEARRGAEIADQAVSVAELNERTSEQLLRAGTAARADVLKQQVTLANSRLQAIQAHNASDLANATLANLLNVNLSSHIEPVERLEVAPPAVDLDTALDAARRRRPEIYAAQAAVGIAKAAVATARAGALPTISLQVADTSSRPNFLNQPQPQLTETLAVTWRLFDGGLTRGRVDEASAQIDKAELQLAQLTNSVDLEVRRAYLNLKAAIAAAQAAQTAQDSADESLRVSQLRYAAGAGTSLELSDALLVATQARNQLVVALGTVRVALADLQRATGATP